jgi:hypothetical protein
MNYENLRVISFKQLNAITALIDKEVIKNNHFREVKHVPTDSICIGYEQASYGDWSYYVTPEGEYVCTYYSIGD